MRPTSSRRLASRWSRSPGSTTCCRSPSFSTCRSASATNAIASRPDRDFGPHVIRNQRSQLHRSLRGLGREGFRHVHVLKSQEEVDAAVIERQPLWNNRKRDRGPFDIIGDVHGCCDELEQLLQQLGYTAGATAVRGHIPKDGKAIFVGDLVDRGPRIVDTLKTVMAMSQAGSALCVPGNHDIKLKRKLEGRDVTVSHGLDRTLAELDQQTAGVPRRRADSSSTASSATTSSTTAGSSWRTPA